MPSTSFHIRPIGVIRTTEEKAWIEIKPIYQAGLQGLSDFSHLHVFFWFHQNDTRENRSVLQVHPKKDPANPLTGVFATHAPVRPNLIGHSVCRCKGIKGNIIFLDQIDALDGSPVIDIKCYLPARVDSADIRLPAWIRDLSKEKKQR